MDEDCEEKALTWSEDYNDPTAEIIMISSDNVGFRGHIWHLAKKSIFLADLVEVAGCGQNDASQTPIHIQQPSPAIRIFLDLVYTSKNQDMRFDEMEWNECSQVLAVCDQFQAPQVEQRFLYALCKSTECRVHFWQIFGVANMRKDIQLAKTIIPRFEADCETHEDVFGSMRYHMKGGMQDMISSTWLAELVEHRVHWDTMGDGFRGHVNSWKEVGEAFNPDRLRD